MDNETKTNDEEIMGEEDTQLVSLKESNEDPLDNMTQEEIEEQSKAAKESFKKKELEKKQSMASETSEDVKADDKKEKTYTEAQVKAMLSKVMGTSEDEDDETPQNSVVRIARFQNKFIVGFKNMNTDEYAPDAVIHAFDIFDDKTRRNVPYVTLMFQDKTEISVPLESVLKRSIKVECELVETVKKDTSYNFGKVEKQEVKEGDYKKTGSGSHVKTKITQSQNTYKVQLPKGGPVVIVSSEVINW